MKLKCKQKNEKHTVYIVCREQIINNSNKLVYCVKKEPKFSKDTNGKETYSKVLTNTPLVFHAETTRTRRYHVVSTPLQHTPHAVYL